MKLFSFMLFSWLAKSELNLANTSFKGFNGIGLSPVDPELGISNNRKNVRASK